MADIRCQMCGKQNPDNLQECKFCGARLKPLIAPSSSSKPKSEETGSNWANTSPEDTLDWLRSLGQDEKSLGGSALTDDLPDWQTEVEPEKGHSSIWMDDSEEDEAFEAETLSEQSNWDVPNADAQLDQWFSGKDESAPAPDEDESLEDFFSKNATSGSEPLPSWLVDKEDEKTVPLSDMFGKPTEADDWLNSLGNEDSITATVSDWKQPTSPAQAPKDDLPDWLSSSPAESAFPESDVFDEDLPSWLKSGGSSQDAAETSAPMPSSNELEGEFPDWLDSLDSKTGMTGKLDNMPEWIDEDKGSGGQESTFDWLSTLGDTPEEEPAPSNQWDKEPEFGGVLGKDAIGGLTLDPEDSFISEVDKDNTPDWMQGIREEEFPAGGGGFQSSWGFDTSPRRESRQDSESRPKEDAITPVEDSSTGGLPSWVKAFRPPAGADIATEHAEGELERVGPLAGLRDLLTPEADITKTTKLPSYSEVLQVSAVQNAHTQLLQSLVEAENVPQPVTQVSLLSSQRILRSVFGVLLILAMLFPLNSGTQIIPLPLEMPQELQNVENLSNGAPLDRPILVAFDYEPGLSGELEVASKALFDHWMERGIPLALVSTSPLGAALGERQVNFLQGRFPYQHEYVPGEDYINLGYIPGGTAGLANFALAPRENVQVSYDNREIWKLFNFEEANPWNSPLLQPIAQLSDFYMTVLLTDNPETARNWIEQVEPALRRNSLVIVTSTQAEPFIRPYFENPEPSLRQVEGLLVGLRGGAAYEQNQGQFGAARLYWDPFGIGLLVAVGLIVLGGGYNYLDQLRKVQRQNRRNKGKKA